MPSRFHIQEEFDSYRKAVIPADAPLVQVVECRRAFYAGAQALRHIVLNAPEGLAGRRFLIEVEEELRDFVRREVAQGHGSPGGHA
jgi:hypothetical protein